MSGLADAAINHTAVEAVQMADSLPSAAYLDSVVNGLSGFLGGLVRRAEVLGWRYDSQTGAYSPAVLRLRSSSSGAEVVVGSIDGEGFLRFTDIGIEAMMRDTDGYAGADSMAFLMARPGVIERYHEYWDSLSSNGGSGPASSDSADAFCGHPFDESQLISGNVALGDLPANYGRSLQGLFHSYHTIAGKLSSRLRLYEGHIPRRPDNPKRHHPGKGHRA